MLIIEICYVQMFSSAMGLKGRNVVEVTEGNAVSGAYLTPLCSVGLSLRLRCREQKSHFWEHDIIMMSTSYALLALLHEIDFTTHEFLQAIPPVQLMELVD